MDIGFYTIWFVQCFVLIAVGGHIYPDLLSFVLWFFAVVSHFAYAVNLPIVQDEETAKETQ